MLRKKTMEKINIQFFCEEKEGKKYDTSSTGFRNIKHPWFFIKQMIMYNTLINSQRVPTVTGSIGMMELVENLSVVSFVRVTLIYGNDKYETVHDSQSRLSVPS